jgi:hypothetical protein
MKIKLNIKRYPFYKELVELAISNENRVFYKEADGSLSKVTMYEGGYQVGGRYYYTLLAGKYIIKGLLPVEMPAKFVEIVNRSPYLILYKGELVWDLKLSGNLISLNDDLENFAEVIKNIDFLKYL